MKTHTLKININNFKKDITNHYFKYRDMYYRMLVTNICIYNYVNNQLLQNTVIEESSYNQYFLHLVNRQLNLTGLLSELNIENELPIYMDISIYIEEFLQIKHSNNHINLYSLTITDDGFLIIENKHLNRITNNA